MDILESLNPAQREAVLTTEGPLLLLAGAGSGKTRVLVSRIAHLVSRGVQPFNILAITFTNKAAREMKHRLTNLLVRGGDVWASTFHSLCVRILRRNIGKIGYDGNFTIYDTEDSTKVMRQIMKEYNINDKVITPQAVLSVIGRKKDSMITPQMHMAEAERSGDFRESQFAELYEVYQKRLRASNALDFDDLIFLTVMLFRQKPDVLTSYQNRFSHISVDEYQDTNYSQYQLIKMLSDKHNNICVVGDDDQSIYGWRGADIRNILEFEKDFPGARVIKLEQNYRSSKTILDAANAVIKENKKRKGKSLWTDNGSGEKIKYFTAETDYDEAVFVANTIKEAAKKGAKYKDFSLLYRMNAQSRLLEERFVRENLPYRVVGGVRFYERREVKDILAYLKTIDNPLDDVSLKRILNVPRRGIGTETELKVNAYAIEMEVPFYDALQSGEEIGLPYNGKRVREFVSLIEDLLIVAKNETVSVVIKKVLERTDYINELFSTEHDKDTAKDRASNVMEMLSKAEEFEKLAAEENFTPSLSAFLEEVALVADIDSYNEQHDAVVLMTVHSAKGLEFNTVFLTGFEQGVFPSSRAIYDALETKLEEERRLCYVAITRAKEKLYITNARIRHMYNNRASNPPSQFLKEIPGELIENYGVPRVQAKAAPMPRLLPPAGSVFVTHKKPPNYGTGDYVNQKKYGRGMVLAIKPAGADYEVTVEFPAVGQKKFMAHLSNLEKTV